MAVQDLSTQFDADWQKAQKRYQEYINVAYTKDETDFIAKSKDKAMAKAAIEAKTAAEADQLYLAPVHAKWKVIQSAPQFFQDKSNLGRINSDFEDATQAASKSAFDRSSDGASPAGDLGPLVQKWATEVTSEKGMAKTSAATQKLQVGDLRSQIKRLETKRGTYTYHLNDAKLDPETAKNYTAAVGNIDSQLADLNGQYKTLLGGGTLPAQPAAVAAPQVQTPFGQPNTSFQPPAETQPSPIVPSAAGGDNISPDLAASGLRMPAPTPFDEFRQQFSAKLDAELQAQAAPATPASNGKFFISGANGKPDLTNYGGGRTEADAAWAARTAPRISPPADIAPVEPTAATVTADQAKPAVAGNNAPIASQEAYDALASGDQYMDAQGNLRRKK
jgi:hypothetical protein